MTRNGSSRGGDSGSGGALARKLAAAEEGAPLVTGRGYRPE